MHPFYDRTRTHWHSETLSYLSRLSLARTLGPIQRLKLAGARHGAGAAAQPQGALAAHSRGVPPNRLRATFWLILVRVWHHYYIGLPYSLDR